MRANVLLVIAALCVLVFVPIYYVYPSRMKRYRAPTLALTAVWALMMTVVLLQYPNPSPRWVQLSLFYPAYYVAVSLLSTVRAAPR